MRDLTGKDKIYEVMRHLGRSSRGSARVYFTGGATAVLMGWRESTVDIDLRFEPELDELFRAIAKIKEQLDVNLELAWPPDFIPLVPGWEERSRYIDTEGKIGFYHYDFYSQALSKIERRHEQDEKDVAAMLKNGLIERDKLLALFEGIKPFLYRYPAIDPDEFARAVEESLV